jgi:hypothetical protein
MKREAIEIKIYASNQVQQSMYQSGAQGQEIYSRKDGGKGEKKGSVRRLLLDWAPNPNLLLKILKPTHDCNSIHNRFGPTLTDLFLTPDL